MSDAPPEHGPEQSNEARDLESREVELALPEWLAEEYSDGDAIIPNIPNMPGHEDDGSEEDAGDLPAVATAWIDPAATRILTERAALLALVASQTRGAGWGAEPPMLAPIQPPVSLESLNVDNDQEPVAEEAADHVPWPLVAAAVGLIVLVVTAVLLVWYFEVL